MSQISHRIEVIVSNVRWSDNFKSWISEGDPQRTRFFDDDSGQVLRFAFHARGKNKSVIIRPTFNEPHLGSLGFREWRSFNGGLFSEIHWNLAQGECSQVRLDRELTLPIIPE